MGNQVINIDLALHIPVNNLRYIGATTGATKGSTAPRAACYQLERSGSNLFPSPCYAHNATFTPAFVASFKRLTHHIYIANTFKAVIHATASHINNMVHHILNVSGVYKVCHTKLLAQRRAGGV